MNVPAKLGAFGVVLALAFGGGLALGSAVGPIDEPTPAPHSTHQDEPAPAPSGGTEPEPHDDHPTTTMGDS